MKIKAQTVRAYCGQVIVLRKYYDHLSMLSDQKRMEETGYQTISTEETRNAYSVQYALKAIPNQEQAAILQRGIRSQGAWGAVTEEIVRLYYDNQVTADQRFRNKQIHVRGQVEQVTNHNGWPCARLIYPLMATREECRNKYTPKHAYLYCYLPDKEATTLRKMQWATIVGKLNTVNYSPKYGILSIIMHNCILLDIDSERWVIR